MKREILFRGKDIGGKRWFYGSYLRTDDNINECFGRKNINIRHQIVQYEAGDWNLGGWAYYDVIPETISQFTGLTDKNGVKIFEGDIFKLGVEKEVFEVRFEHGCFMAFCNGKQYGLIGELQMCFINIIGNIHDNPELLK